MVLILEDFIVGDLLGTGSFATVYLATVRSHHSAVENTQKPRCTKIQQGGIPTYHYRHDQYALKKIKTQKSNSCGRKIGLEELQIEAELLASLPKHEHIVVFKGMSKDLFTPNGSDGFILMECLHESLDQRLHRLRNRKIANEPSWITTRCKQTFSSKRLPEKLDQCNRIKTIGCGIAKAMAFIHTNNILYRDLKPSNIGFDLDGTVKIFDFGLSRMYPDSECDRLLTMRIGTPRYMSPELSLGKEYGFSTDVYSFGILLWEICTLNRPFKQSKTLEELHVSVCELNKRPSLQKVWIPEILNLLACSWATIPDSRPSFLTIAKTLEIFE